MTVERSVSRVSLKVLAVIGILAAFGLPQLQLGGWLFPGQEVGARIGREALWWAIAALILLWVLRVERLPLSSIGLKRPTRGTFGWALVGLITLIASVMLSYAVILPALGLEMNRAATASITALPLWLQFAMFIRAGFVEEILYRGYPIERIEALTGSKWIGGLVPAVVFVAAHYAWGGGQLIVVAFGAAILTLLYLWRRDLICCMLAHVSTDIIGFTLARLQS